MKLSRYFLLATFGISASVAAAPIDNPGNFVWDTGAAQVQFNQTSPRTLTVPGSSGTLDADLDSGGNFTFNVFTIHSVADTNGYTLLVQVTAATSSGTLDASVGGWDVAMSLKLKVKITGNGLPNTCVTSVFTAPFEGFYQYDGVTDQGTMELYTGTGGSVGGTTGWLTVPALTTGCGGGESTLNGIYGFGGANQGIDMQRLTAKTIPGPQGS